ncbi:MAG TPA: SRPBCC domain-containing protein [Acidimicrobiales bacterium]|jgi:uncharacterized protein YndB with AHSA1/START domain
MEPVTVTRVATFDTTVEELWAHLATEAGLAGWLGHAVELDVALGAAGRLVDGDGNNRRLVVSELAEGSSLGFVWWDESDPAIASAVSLALDEVDGQARLTVTETLDASLGAAAGGGRICDVVEAGQDTSERWGLRLGLLAERAGLLVSV